MNKINQPELLKNAYSSLNSVFNTINIYEEPMSFRDTIESKVLLYLKSDENISLLWSALRHAAAFMGEHLIYASTLWSNLGKGFEKFEYFLLDIAEIEYFEIEKTGAFEAIRSIPNAYYSTSGSWGVYDSDEGYFLVGGTREFLSILCSYYPFCETDLDDFTNYWLNLVGNNEPALKHYKLMLDAILVEKDSTIYLNNFLF